MRFLPLLLVVALVAMSSTTALIPASPNEDSSVVRRAGGGVDDWALIGGGSSFDGGVDVVTASDGAVYMLGFFRNTVEFAGPTVSVSSNGLRDVLVAKADYVGGSGVFWSWARSAGGPESEIASAIAIDSTDDLIITGTFKDWATFGSTNLTSTSENDTFVAKISPVGSWRWAVSTSGLGNVLVTDVAVDSQDQIYVTGTVEGNPLFGGNQVSTSGKEMFVARLDDEGNWEWVATAGGSSPMSAVAMDVDHDDGAVVVGNYFSDASFGSHQVSGSGWGPMYSARVDSLGNWSWATTFGGTDRIEPADMQLDSQGNLAIIGQFNGSADFDGPTYTQQGGATSRDVFVGRMTTAGTWLWAHQLDGPQYDTARGLDLDDGGNIVFTVDYNDTISLGNAAVTSTGSTDFLLAKLSAGGEMVYFESNGGPTNFGIDAAGGAALDDQGNVWATGWFRGGTTQLGPFSLSIGGNGGENDIFLMRRGTPDFDEDGLDDSVSPSDQDSDEDNDGIPDVSDDCPRGTLNWTSSAGTDADGDGCNDDYEDTDDDTDGIHDLSDNCPRGATGWTSTPANDHDRDGCRDSDEDDDDDDDGVLDTADDCALGDVGWTSSNLTDNDGDGCQDASAEDTDDDNDGIPDSGDDCSSGETGWSSSSTTDFDGDGCQDSGEDTDDDNDLVLDADDRCPTTGVGLSVDLEGCAANERDTDLDGIVDSEDDCPDTAAGATVDSHGCAEGQGAAEEGSSAALVISIVVILLLVAGGGGAAFYFVKIRPAGQGSSSSTSETETASSGEKQENILDALTTDEDDGSSEASEDAAPGPDESA